MSQLITNIEQPITNIPTFTDLRQTNRAHFFRKTINIQRATRKTAPFWFYIFKCTTFRNTQAIHNITMPLNGEFSVRKIVRKLSIFIELVKKVTVFGV